MWAYRRRCRNQNTGSVLDLEKRIQDFEMCQSSDDMYKIEHTYIQSKIVVEQMQPHQQNMQPGRHLIIIMSVY